MFNTSKEQIMVFTTFQNLKKVRLVLLVTPIIGCQSMSKPQVSEEKLVKISLKNIRKNDLIFWKGHVAVAISKHNLIHAYGPLKKTLVMPIKKTIDRIYRTTNLKVLGIRRLV